MQGKGSKYQLVADTVARDIVEQRFLVGTLLPTETELAARFKVSRHTIRHGLRELRSRGMIVSRQGRGSEVIATGSVEVRGETTYTVSDFLNSPFNWQLKIDTVEAVFAGQDRAQVLGCDPLARLLEVQGTFSNSDDAAACLSTSAVIYTDALYSGFFDSADGPLQPLPLLLADAYGLRIKRVVQELSMEPTPDDSSGLAGRVIVTLRYFSMDEKVFLMLRASCPPSAFSIVTSSEIDTD